MRLPWFGAPLLAVLVAGLGCGGDATADPVPPVPSEPSTPQDLPAFDPNPCAHLAGPTSQDEREEGLARAHTMVRFFAPEPNPRVVDAALADLLAPGEPNDGARLDVYASAIGGCMTKATVSRLGPAEVQRSGALVVVKPGTTRPEIPADATQVAIDLRDLPDDPGLDAALRTTVIATLSGAGGSIHQRVRRCNGLPDEVYAMLTGITNVYACNPTTVRGEPWTGEGRAEHVVLWTSPRMAPASARWAAALRLQQRARIVGEHVLGAVAEMRTRAFYGFALGSRVAQASLTSDILPDVLHADVRTATPDRVVFDETPPGEADVEASTRSPIGVWNELADRPPSSSARRGDAQAALLVAHGTLERFFPFFEEVGTPAPPALAALVAAIPEGEPAVVRNAMVSQLFSLLRPLVDGHASPYFLEPSRPASLPPASTYLVPVGDQLLVASTQDPALQRGDVVITVDDKPASERLSFIEERLSGSPLHRRWVAARQLLGSVTTVEVTAEDGSNPRRVTLDRSSPPKTLPWERAPGALADLAADDIYYVSLNAGGRGAVPLSEVRAGIHAARGGVVLDMRGYPDMDSWKVLGMVVDAAARGPVLTELQVTPDTTLRAEPERQVLSLFGVDDPEPYTGKVVLLAGPDSQSQAEHLISFFRDRPRGHVIGLQTSGANGNITGVQLPGAFGITFTGMHVRNADESRFHGIGHHPDIEQGPTRTSLADGTDATLLRAIADLREGP